MKLTQETLKQIADECALKITNLKLDQEIFDEPFRHCIVDNFLPHDLAISTSNGFPDTDSDKWDRSNDADIEVKQRTLWKSEFDIPDDVLPAIRILNSSILLNAYAEAIKINKLMPDPYFTGGGLNVTKRGGLLDVHVDGNYHDASGLNRRINVLLYLSPNYKKEWGGEFGLYHNNGDDLYKKIEPKFNRLLIFDTHDKSYHGLPEPFECPEGESRKSVILYYYTKEPRIGENIVVDEPHSALWKKRNLLDKRGNLTRNFT